MANSPIKTIRLPPELAAALEAAVTKRKQSPSEIMIAAIAKDLGVTVKIRKRGDRDRPPKETTGE